jgi:3,4-dihydroxy 2-butanone 4-phosphate synthase/GTP cyclohydrolase II
MPANKPFAPRSIPEARRFVHVASYFLPVKPQASLMTKEEVRWARRGPRFVTRSDSQYESMGVLLPYELSADGEFLVEVQDKTLYERFPAVLRRPYWFTCHVYYDIQTQTEFVVLEYRDCRNPKRPPYVRIHSESIFSRFPLKVRRGGRARPAGALAHARAHSNRRTSESTTTACTAS